MTDFPVKLVFVASGLEWSKEVVDWARGLDLRSPELAEGPRDSCAISASSRADRSVEAQRS